MARDDNCVSATCKLRVSFVSVPLATVFAQRTGERRILKRYVVLAGPTLDKALALARLGKISLHREDALSLEQDTCVSSSSDLAQFKEHVSEALVGLITPAEQRPVHLYVTSRRQFHASKKVVHHLLSSDLPAGSFMSLGDGIIVPSWELYFLLRCRDEERLSKRLMIGMELCGTYTHLRVADESTTTYYRQPSMVDGDKLVCRWNDPKVSQATTPQKLAEFAQSAKRLRGVSRMRGTLSFLKDNSASPLESIFAIMASLPCRLGGYGFMKAELNPKMEVPANKRCLTRFDAYHPDCYLEAIDLDLEVESRERHSSPRAIERDKARRNDIQAVGVEVKDVTWGMISHFDDLELLFDQVLHKERELGLDDRGRHARSVKRSEHVARRRALLQELLPDWPYEP